MQVNPVDTVKVVLVGIGTRTGHAEVEDFMKAGTGHLQGKTLEELDEMGAKFTRSVLGGYLYADALDKITEHQKAGHVVVIASSRCRSRSIRWPTELGIEHVLCSKLAVDADGRCTGEVDGEMLWGQTQGAGRAGLRPRTRTSTLDASFAYGNGDEDLEFLSSGGQSAPDEPGAGTGGDRRTAGLADREIRAALVLLDPGHAAHRGCLRRLGRLRRGGRGLRVAQPQSPGWPRTPW